MSEQEKSVSPQELPPKPPLEVPPLKLEPIKPEPREGITLAIFSGVICLSVGLWLGRYTGPMPLIPLISGVILGWPFARLSKGRRKALSPSFAILAGHFVFVAWYLTFARMPDGTMPGGVWSFFIDMIFLFLASAWIIVAPSLLSVCAIGCYQTLMLIINLIQRSFYGELGSWSATSLSVQIFLRLLCLVILLMAVWQLQKLHNEERAINPLHVT
jgi:hypothetical protein